MDIKNLSYFVTRAVDYLSKIKFPQKHLGMLNIDSGAAGWEARTYLCAKLHTFYRCYCGDVSDVKVQHTPFNATATINYV